MQPAYKENLELAQRLVKEGKGQEMMPRAAFWAPITAQRLVDLHQPGGRDDYFSSDYTDAQLEARLSVPDVFLQGNNNLHVLVAYSGADEYIPAPA